MNGENSAKHFKAAPKNEQEAIDNVLQEYHSFNNQKMEPKEGIFYDRSWMRKNMVRGPVQKLNNVNCESDVDVENVDENIKEVNLECEVCQDKFSRSLILSDTKNVPICPLCRLKKSWDENDAEKCSLCGREIDPEKKFKCGICHSAFFEQEKLEKHQLVHTDHKLYNCPVCDDFCVTLEEYEAHKLSHIVPNQIYECRVCGECFITGCKLKLHLKIHTCEIMKICTLCSDDLKMGMPVRQEDQPTNDIVEDLPDICIDESITDEFIDEPTEEPNVQ